MGMILKEFLSAKLFELIYHEKTFFLIGFFFKFPGNNYSAVMISLFWLKNS